MAEATQTINFRLPADMHEQLQFISLASGISMNTIVRECIAEWISRKRREPEFRKKLLAEIKRLEKLLE